MSDATTPETPAPVATPLAVVAAPAPMISAPVVAAPAVVAPVAPPVAMAPTPAAPASDTTRLDALTADVAAMRAVIAATVAQDLAGVPANVRAAVLSIAGDDPVRQRTTLDAMRANGLSAAPVGPQVVPVGATTTPVGATPATPAVPAAADPSAAILAEYERLLAGGARLHATGFRAANDAAITRALAARAAPRPS